MYLFILDYLKRETEKQCAFLSRVTKSIVVSCTKPSFDYKSTHTSKIV